MKSFSHLGQATVEYIFILAVVLMLSFKIVDRFTEFFRSGMGSVGHVLSTHLNVGICANTCFFSNYRNGYQP